eukprot:s8392_g1.t1
MQDLLARALQYPNSCTPWSVTLFAEPPDDETLKVLLAREMEQGAPGIFTRKIRTHLSLFGVTSGWASLKRDARLVVARSTFMIEWPRKEGFPRHEGPPCEVLQGGSAGNSLQVWRKSTQEEEQLLHILTKACDDYLDPEAVVDLQGKAAQNVNDLLKLCAPVSGLARATGVKPGNFSSEHSLGPVALRPFVWHHLFHQGHGMPVSRTERIFRQLHLLGINPE